MKKNTNSNNSSGNIEQAKETHYTNQQNFINFILNLYSENLRLSSSVGKMKYFSLQLLFESRSVFILLAKLQGKIQFFPLLSRTFVPE